MDGLRLAALVAACVWLVVILLVRVIRAARAARADAPALVVQVRPSSPGPVLAAPVTTPAARRAERPSKPPVQPASIATTIRSRRRLAFLAGEILGPPVSLAPASRRDSRG